MQDDSLIGTLFAGRFHIQSLLGKGGMGAVYLGRHAVLDRLFAVKVIQKGLITDLDVAARFRREARAAGRVQHPNITAVVDFGHTEDGRPYLVMEYADGLPLSDVIRKESPLALPRAMRILAQVSDALAAAHACQVVHRDLKPQNILLTTYRQKSDVVKVLDFGLAKIVGVGSTALTRDGEAMGTPDYMSPEQCVGRDIDLRSDIYSFGAMAFDLLVGAPPFSGPVLGKVDAHLNESPPIPSTRRSDLPKSVDALVLRCMAKKREDRFQSAAEMSEALNRIRRELGDSAKRRRMAVYFDEETGSISYDGFVTGGESHESLDGWDDESTVEWSHATNLGQHLSIDEMACALRDRGLGSSKISGVLAQKVAAEDRVFAIQSEIATLEANLAEVETSARSREARLRQALTQLQHEKDNLMAAAGKTLPLGSRALSTEVDVRAAQLEENAVGIAGSIRELNEHTEKRMASLHERIAKQRRQLAEAHQEAEGHHTKLARLVEEARAG